MKDFLVSEFASDVVRSLVQDPIGNYPFSTVACFDPTSGQLPRRRLDQRNTERFLGALCAPWGESPSDSVRADAFLIGASTGQGHLRTVDELADWFRIAAGVRSIAATKSRFEWPLLTALLRPEDGHE